MKTAIFFLGMFLCAGLIPLTCGATIKEAGKQGTISQFSIEDRTMLINEKEYLLADKLQVVTKNDIAGGEMILKKGQSIEFWTDTKTTFNKNVEKGKETLPLIKRIRVLSDVKMDY